MARLHENVARLPEKGDIFERLAAWLLNRTDIQPIVMYQKEHYRHLLATQVIVSYKHRNTSLCIHFKSGDRIHFHRVFLRYVINLVEDYDSELVVKNTFFLDNLDRVLH